MDKTEELLKEDLGKDARVACIGPSGERLSLISCIVNNRGRVAARSGLGAVMGAKRLKALVAKGKGEVPLADKAGIEAMRRRYLKSLSGPVDMYRNFGTCGATACRQWA